jgi:hypothetical protein
MARRTPTRKRKKNRRKRVDPLFRPIKAAIVTARNKLRVKAKRTGKTGPIHREYLKLKTAYRTLGFRPPLMNIINS